MLFRWKISSAKNVSWWSLFYLDVSCVLFLSKVLRREEKVVRFKKVKNWNYFQKVQDESQKFSKFLKRKGLFGTDCEKTRNSLSPKKKFREINCSLVTSSVKMLFSRNFCHKSVRENFRNFHTVRQAQWFTVEEAMK